MTIGDDVDTFEQMNSTNEEGKASMTDKTCKQLQSMNICKPGEECALHKGALPDRAAELRESIKPTSKRVSCKLCAFEGVLGTVLCNGHLEGFQYACKLLQQTKHAALARLLAQAIGHDVAAMPDERKG